MHIYREGTSENFGKVSGIKIEKKGLFVRKKTEFPIGQTNVIIRLPSNSDVVDLPKYIS